MFSEELRKNAVREALAALKLLRPSAESTILELMKGCATEHPAAVATAFRRGGEQISGEEKKVLGIRKNGFMSKVALAQLTELGRQRPLNAHSETLLRAALTELRGATTIRGKAHGVRQIRHHGTFYMECPGCGRLNGVITSIEDASIYPPPDCARAACGLSLSPHINFFQGLK